MSEGPVWNNDGNAFGPKVATILHSQMLARGMAGAELVHPQELSAMGHHKLEEKRMDAPLVAVRAGSLGLATEPGVVSGVVVRPSSSYDLLHVASQTSLRPIPKRLLDGRNAEERAVIGSTVETLVARSGVQLKTHGGERIAITMGSSGPQVAHPARERFGSMAEYATSVMRAVSTAAARSPELSRCVQDEEMGRRAVASTRRRERRQIPAGGARYAEVQAEAAAQVANRGVKAIAARENVYLATDQPRDEAHFDAETRTLLSGQEAGPGAGQARHAGAAVQRADADGPRRRGRDPGRAQGGRGRPGRRSGTAGRGPGAGPQSGARRPQRDAGEGADGDGRRSRRAPRPSSGWVSSTPRSPPSEQARKDQATYARTPGALDQAWREAASVRAHLVSRDWEYERTPEMLEHSAASTFESPARTPATPEAQERGGPEQARAGRPAGGAGGRLLRPAAATRRWSRPDRRPLVEDWGPAPAAPVPLPSVRNGDRAPGGSRSRRAGCGGGRVLSPVPRGRRFARAPRRVPAARTPSGRTSRTTPWSCTRSSSSAGCRRARGSSLPSTSAGSSAATWVPAASPYEERFLLESGDRRGIAVGIAGTPAVALRPGAYRVLHSQTQTTLAPAPDPRVLGGRDPRDRGPGGGPAGAGWCAGARLEPGDQRGVGP